MSTCTSLATYVVTSARSAVTVNGQCVQLLIDSGSNVNLLDKFTFDWIGTILILRVVTKKIHSYGSNEPLPVLGKVTADVVSGKKLISATFYIVEGSHICLLGYDTCTELGLLHITNAVSSTPVEKHIASQYPELFEGLGKLSWTKIKLYIDTEVKPTAQSQRGIPFHTRRKVEESNHQMRYEYVLTCVCQIRQSNEKDISLLRWMTFCTTSMALLCFRNLISTTDTINLSWIPQYDT